MVAVPPVLPPCFPLAMLCTSHQSSFRTRTRLFHSDLKFPHGFTDTENKTQVAFWAHRPLPDRAPPASLLSFFLVVSYFQSISSSLPPLYFGIAFSELADITPYFHVSTFFLIIQDLLNRCFSRDAFTDPIYTRQGWWIPSTFGGCWEWGLMQTGVQRFPERVILSEMKVAPFSFTPSVLWHPAPLSPSHTPCPIHIYQFCLYSIPKGRAAFCTPMWQLITRPKNPH